MDSKVDKQIRRYLKRISNRVVQATTYNSYHYEIDYDEGTSVHVRFSDHLRSPHHHEIIDIVKMNSDVYILSVKSMQYSVSADKILDHIKSLMVFAPELAKFITNMTKANEKMLQKTTKLGEAVGKEVRKLRKQYSEAESLLELYDEIDNKHREASQEINRLNQELDSKDKIIEQLSKKIKVLEICNNQVANLMGKIRNTTDQAKREITLANNLIK